MACIESLKRRTDLARKITKQIRFHFKFILLSQSNQQRDGSHSPCRKESCSEAAATDMDPPRSSLDCGESEE